MKPFSHPPWFKPLILILHLNPRRAAAVLAAACLTLPIVLQLMAVSGPTKPVVVVDDFINHISRTGVPISNDLIIASQSYDQVAVTEAAISTLQTLGNVAVNPMSAVIFETGKRITLKSGFRAAQGSRFRARIDFSVESLNRPTETGGIPYGLTTDINKNGVPDMIEINLGFDLTTGNYDKPQIQNYLQSKRLYGYDKNNQLINDQTRTYNLDPEGNILNNN